MSFRGGRKKLVCLVVQSHATLFRGNPIVVAVVITGHRGGSALPMREFGIGRLEGSPDQLLDVVFVCLPVRENLTDIEGRPSESGTDPNSAIEKVRPASTRIHRD